jgi:hypothetical protein
MKRVINAHLPLNILLLVFIIFLGFSCRKDSTKASWDVDLLLPLAKDSIALYDILDEQFFVENPDRSVSLVFDEELYKVSLDSLVKLPDTLISFGVSLDFLPEPISLQPGDTVLAASILLPLDLDGEDVQGVMLEKVILETGAIVFEAYNQSNTDLYVVLGIEGVYHPEKGDFFAEETVNNNELFQKDFDISDYHIDLRGPNQDTLNMLSYYVALIIHPNEPDEVTIFPEDSVALNAYFKNVVSYYSRGYFGKNSFTEGPEIYPIDFLNDFAVQNISFEEAEINFTIENTYGLEVNFRIEDLKAINTNKEDTVTLESIMIDSALFVDRAHEIVEESGEIEIKSGSFDFTDSNFPDLFAIQPNQMSYTMSADVNIRGDSTNYDNFFYIDRPVRVLMKARVDGGIRFDSLFQSDRLLWQASEVNLREVKEGVLKLYFNNAFPFDFNMNLYLENTDSIVIDTLIYQQFIDSGFIGDDGFVESLKKTVVEIPLDDDLKEQFKNGQYVYYEIYINSANSEGVNIHAENYLSFQVIGDFIYLFEQN